MGAECGFAVEWKRPRRSRAVARALVVRGAFRVGVAFLSGSFLATSCRPSPPLHFAVLEPGVGCSRCRQSRQTQPQTSPLRSSFLLTPFRGALVRCGVGVACGATRAPSAICFEGCHTHASAFSGFLGGCRKFGSARAIDAPDKKPAAAGGSTEASASGPPECSVRCSLRSLPPQASLRSPLHTLAALRPSQELRAPASGTGFVPQPVPPAPDPWRSPGRALRERPSCRRGVLARAAASGRYRRQALSSSLPALPRSFVACAAWSLLRERLTPRPPTARDSYRFGFRQNKLVNLLGGAGKTKQPGSVGGSTLFARRSNPSRIAAARGWSGVVGWASRVRASSVRAERRRGSGARSPHTPQPSPALGAGGSASANASPPLHRPTHGNGEGGYGTRLTAAYVGNWVKRSMKQAGIEKAGSCHLLRHTCATHMHDNGADIRFIQQLLGHARLDTTQIYTEVSIVKLQEVHARTHPHGLNKRPE